MCLDRSEMLSDQQGITASGPSASVLDLGARGLVFPSGTAGKFVVRTGDMRKLPFCAWVTQGFDHLTSLTLAIQCSHTQGFTSLTTLYTSPAYGLSDLQPGAARIGPDALPDGTYDRYLRLFYTITGTAPSIGRISAGLCDARLGRLT